MSDILHTLWEWEIGFWELRVVVSAIALVIIWTALFMRKDTSRDE